MTISLLMVILFAGLIGMMITIGDSNSERVPTELNDTAPDTYQFVYSDLGPGIVLILILAMFVWAAKQYGGT